MSQRYKGAVISATPPTTSGGSFGNAPGIWTMQQQLQAQGAGTWPAFTPSYVEDVFSSYLYKGNSGSQIINNGIALGNTLSSSLQGYPITVVTGNFASPYLISYINDGIATSTNSDFAFSSTGFDVYVTFPTAVTLTAYNLAPQGGVNTPYNTPTGFVVLASNDASSWTTIATFTSISTGSPNWDPSLYRTFSFSNTTAYKYWRLQCTGTGSGGAGNSLAEWRVTGTTSVVGNGGLVWVKSRTSASNNWLIDTARGALNAISSEITAAQVSYANSVTSFNDVGFSLGSNGDWNSSSNNYVSWTFREQPKFFDVVTYTGTGVARTISHNLRAVPGCMIIKRLDDVTNWPVYHRSNLANDAMFLNTTDAINPSKTYWNNTRPTSTVFSLGDDAIVNANGGTYVAYLFAHDAGGFGLNGTDNVISCGSWTDTGSGTQTITLGYEPQFLIYKRADSNSNWVTLDNMRGWPVLNAAGSTANLYPNLSNAESGGNYGGNGPTATGFNMPTLGGGTYIYIAIRRGPMRTPTNGTSVYFGSANTESTGVKIATNFPVDLQIAAFRSIATNRFAIDRLRGTSSSTTESSQILRPNVTDAEISASYARYWNNTGYQVSSAYADNSMIEWNFGRAPGYMDVVCYTGTGSATTQNHNLGVAPEFMLVKSRSNSTDWMVYAAPLGNTQTMYFQRDNPAQVYPAWNNTTPTSTVFSLNGGGYAVNNSGNTYVAYLFASCPGVSKVGSYSGTGATQTISCGFAARFVLIKRTDDYADWLVWDTSRGMVSGTDPRLVMNLTSVEANANWVYTNASGFQIVTTDASVNANGGSYIYLAIA